MMEFKVSVWARQYWQEVAMFYDWDSVDGYLELCKKLRPQSTYEVQWRTVGKWQGGIKEEGKPFHYSSNCTCDNCERKESK